MDLHVRSAALLRLHVDPHRPLFAIDRLCSLDHHLSHHRYSTPHHLRDIPAPDEHDAHPGAYDLDRTAVRRFAVVARVVGCPAATECLVRKQSSLGMYIVMPAAPALDHCSPSTASTTPTTLPVASASVFRYVAVDTSSPSTLTSIHTSRVLQLSTSSYSHCNAYLTPPLPARRHVAALPPPPPPP
ncbi:hypothetical protein R3P38DRAFT_3272830 [Favolaschia claudopus]|uniref:Uncharacterized protein n=1 Tax=Favolaschia claudopus TaxID=2862362 RepID=A0AAW0B2Y6_9AGAR